MERLGRVSRRSGVTRYHQLYTYLRRALLDGSIGPGSALPSETELMRQYDLSRNTVRKALSNLERERLVIRLRGSGTYARNKKESDSACAGLFALARNGDSFEQETQVKVLQFAAVATPEHVLQRWRAFGDQSMLVYRTRSYSGEVFALCTSYVPAAAGKSLTRERLGSGSVLNLLARLDQVPTNGTLSITAAQADAVIARHLDVLDGSPVLRTEAIALGSDGRPIEYRVHVYRPDRFRLEFPLTFEPERAPGWSVHQSFSMCF